jgi:hypothetical protein
MAMGIRYRGTKIHAGKNTHEAAYSLIEEPRDSIIVDIPCGEGAFVLRLMDGGVPTRAGRGRRP